MERKKVLRRKLLKTIGIIYWIAIAILIVSLLLGEDNIVTRWALILNFINIIYNLGLYMFHRISYKNRLKLYVEVYRCLQDAHSMRYRCYLNANTERAEQYSELVEKCADALLSTGEKVRDDIRAKENEIKLVQDIMDKTKRMMTTIRTP